MWTAGVVWGHSSAGGRVKLSRLVYRVLGEKVRLKLKLMGITSVNSGHDFSLVEPGILIRKLNIYWYFDLFVCFFIIFWIL